MKLNLPTLLTLGRIAILPVGVLFYLLPITYAHQLAAICVAIVGLTDYLDGYLARKWNQGTAFGAFLDPVADKMAAITGCILITGYFCNAFITICSMVIILREMLISALREWMAELGKRVSMKVRYMGKVKALVQAIAVLFLIWYHAGSPFWILVIGQVLFAAAVILTLWSMVNYLRLAWPDFVIMSASHDENSTS